MSKEIFDQLETIDTEQRNQATCNIDRESTHNILLMMNNEDLRVAVAVRDEIPYIERAVEILLGAFKAGGRLIYVGAGTSGRLGVLDASECPPTFGVDPEMVQGLIAGGQKALVRAQEGAEDLYEQGAEDLMAKEVTPRDVVCGIAASRRTPYVVGAIEQARIVGCKTLYITCTQRQKMNIEVDVAICPFTGPEVLMGSTRLKAGTATKLVLNMLTTTAMIRLGKVYENMMVDLQMTSKKLEERSKRTLIHVFPGLSYDEADKLLREAAGHVKTAIVMRLTSCDRTTAHERLRKNDGFIYRAVQNHE
ncbi:MAG TPA: N-acetylmuramic acid 6-phosphate etherase [bacterium]|nr:N-acetylmuramic acid 6-phosphate etherase [bacterium]HPG44618.1 N-acetylmuramic acid 6-phosphate etherase [bacterium]HPM97176.1 N-acetylmuramic acid 6-phosphate etherase [bacterium]